MLAGREFNVRLAIGARPGEVVAMLIRQGVWPIVAGSAIGLWVSVVAAPLLGRWLFGIAPTDATTVGGALAIVMIVGIVACSVPARRAGRTDPAAAFRTD
jgi:putative ABC transport system permease protein